MEIITKGNKDLLEVLRHDAAHVMAEAVLELYPDTQITIGPAIDNGFYYDFYKKENFTPKDLELIEKRMHEIVDRNEEIIREVWTRDKAINFFKKNNEKFDLIFLDPPFKDNKINLLIKIIKNMRITSKKSMIIIHRNKKIVEDISKDLVISKEKSYGLSKIIFGKIY